MATKNIQSKIESDRKYEGCQKNKELQQILKNKSKAASNYSYKYKEIFHTVSSNFLPGFRLIRGRIMSPLIFASVKIIQYSLPEAKMPSSNRKRNKICNKLKEKFGELGLEDNNEFDERRQIRKKLSSTKRTFVEMKRIDNTQAFSFRNEALEIISSLIDFETFNNNSISQQVIQNFTVKILEFDQERLQTILSPDLLDYNENINLRIIKPCKAFYNRLIRICLQFGVEYLNKVHFNDFLESVKTSFGQEWNSAFLLPVKTFYKLAIGEFENMSKKCLNFSHFSISHFFDDVKCKLLQKWSWEVIERTGEFKRFKREEDECEKYLVLQQNKYGF